MSRLHYVENRWSRSNIEISASICFTIVARGGNCIKRIYLGLLGEIV